MNFRGKKSDQKWESYRTWTLGQHMPSSSARCGKFSISDVLWRLSVASLRRGIDQPLIDTIYPSEEPSFHGEAKPQSVRARSVPVNLYLNKVQQIQQCLKHVWVYSFARTFAFDLAQLEDAASWKCQKMWFQSWWIFWILIFGCIKPSIVSI